MKQFLEIGKVVTTHGVEGELRVYPWCDNPSDMNKIKTMYLDENGQKPLKALSVRTHKNIVIVKFENYDSIDKSRVLIEKTLFANRNDMALPKGRYFICDLIGARVLDETSGEEYGVITDVLNHGATDIYCLKLASGEERMIPAVDEIVISRDIEAGVVKIKPIAGLLYDED